MIKKMNKRGGFSDLFILMIFALVIVFISVLWIFMGGEVSDKLHEQMDLMDLSDGTNNASVVIDNTIGKTNTSFQALTWISVLLIVGMAISIFIGSYLVTTKPIFLIPYIFIVIIAVIVSVPLSNTYETLMTNEILSDSFNQFTGANYLMLHLPIWITIIGIAGGIIMFTRMGSREERMYGY